MKNNIRKTAVRLLSALVILSLFCCLAACKKDAPEDDPISRPDESGSVAGDETVPEQPVTQAHIDDAEAQVRAVLETYFEGINEADPAKLESALPRAVAAAMGKDYDEMLTDLLNVERDKLTGITGEGGSVKVEVKSVTAVSDEDFARNSGDLGLLFSLSDIRAIFEAELERVYYDKDGAEVGRSTEEPLAIYSPIGWSIIMS